MKLSWYLFLFSSVVAVVSSQAIAVTVCDLTPETMGFPSYGITLPPNRVTRCCSDSASAPTSSYDGLARLWLPMTVGDKKLQCPDIDYATFPYGTDTTWPTNQIYWPMWGQVSLLTLLRSQDQPAFYTAGEDFDIPGCGGYFFKSPKDWHQFQRSRTSESTHIYQMCPNHRVTALRSFDWHGGRVVDRDLGEGLLLLPSVCMAGAHLEGEPVPPPLLCKQGALVPPESREAWGE